MIEPAHVLSMPVTAATFEAFVDKVKALAAADTGSFICVANVHMVVTARRDPPLRQAMEEAVLVSSDGMPLVWCLKRSGHPRAQRVAGPDLTVRLCEQAARDGLSVYFYGGQPAIRDALETNLRERFPGLKIAGVETPGMISLPPEYDPETVERINAAAPDIVFVGLGCPKQELWMRLHAPKTKAVFLGVGQAFDILAGAIDRAPAWVQRLGLEWAFRITQDPGRLIKRYAVTNTQFAWDLLRHRNG